MIATSKMADQSEVHQREPEKEIVEKTKFRGISKPQRQASKTFPEKKST